MNFPFQIKKEELTLITERTLSTGASRGCSAARSSWGSRRHRVSVTTWILLRKFLGLYWVVWTWGWHVWRRWVTTDGAVGPSSLVVKADKWDHEESHGKQSLGPLAKASSAMRHSWSQRGHRTRGRRPSLQRVRFLLPNLTWANLPSLHHPFWGHFPHSIHRCCWSSFSNPKHFVLHKKPPFFKKNLILVKKVMTSLNLWFKEN